jgi:hypothetical protein
MAGIMKKLKLGIMGMSEGNGHPYSWSAIFNGFNAKKMSECPFPVIPDYLSKQIFPTDFLTNLGEVTHIWTQDIDLSKNIAESSNISNILLRPEEMIDKVDAVLLARDDAENHYQLALPFLEAGLPIFIDKPLALSLAEAYKILSHQKYSDQVFTCSSLRYSEELMITEDEKNSLAKIYHVEGTIMKKWDTYAVHLIEPIISQLPFRGKLNEVKSISTNTIKTVLIVWQNVSALIKVTGDIPVPLRITFFSKNQSVEKVFSDSFRCFRSSLDRFVSIVNGVLPNINRDETLEIIEIIEKGRKI